VKNFSGVIVKNYKCKIIVHGNSQRFSLSDFHQVFSTFLMEASAIGYRLLFISLNNSGRRERLTDKTSPEI